MFELIEKQDMEGIACYLITRMAIVLVCWAFVFCANVLDFWSGRATAKALAEPFVAKDYGRTFVTIGDFYRGVMLFLRFDLIGSLFEFYKLPCATLLGSVSVIAIELKSVIENSRRKKSHSAEIPNIVKEIIQCSTPGKGKEILEKLIMEVGNDSKRDTN